MNSGYICVFSKHTNSLRPLFSGLARTVCFPSSFAPLTASWSSTASVYANSPQQTRQRSMYLIPFSSSSAKSKTRSRVSDKYKPWPYRAYSGWLHPRVMSKPRCAIARISSWQAPYHSKCSLRGESKLSTEIDSSTQSSCPFKKFAVATLSEPPAIADAEMHLELFFKAGCTTSPSRRVVRTFALKATYCVQSLEFSIRRAVTKLTSLFDVPEARPCKSSQVTCRRRHCSSNSSFAGTLWQLRQYTGSSRWKGVAAISRMSAMLSAL
mmetsp:Transcript_13665/g.25873  ORF Transcript_13665/g.25873 Transcript_13665/m.25873 type:complete len:267 (+) Transcript_13665:132-932(+)